MKGPRRFEGGLVLNAFGYHALRILGFKIAYALRRKIESQDANVKRVAEEVLRDGIVVLPNYFSEEVFSKIKREADSLNLATVNERAPRILRSVIVADGRPTSNETLETYFAKNDFLNGVAATVLRKKILLTPTVQVERSWYAQEDLGKESTDKADNLHFDVSYPTVKAFLYLNDVSADNAAFSYARGSQKMTLARLWMEYKMSVKFWLWDKKSRETITPEVSREFLKNNGFELKSIVGKANTLLIVNTMGMHRRGDYAMTTPREMVNVSYRVLETFKFFLRELRQKR
ncbi:MAG: phytanoyl-CoA dioxygenase family protein [Patescibacteria group bacterium]|jgi:hypothetical protein